ncbi:MAG: L-serine ammonia-lyase, iron-sulfur-dependent, subunit alpha [Lachnospiraceae bacterium]|nr:L-serine ammonia-lyase, iron-sulfur-dependent, subunit alpha [Lachnospiraceae bacterium]
MFQSVESMIQISEEKKIPLWQVVLEDDMVERSVDKVESLGAMSDMYCAMKEADANYDKELKSSSKLVGGDGAKMERAVKEGNVSSGTFIGKVMARAIKMGESNACMKRIVAAPTAGSCGVIPAVLISFEEEFGYNEEKMIEAMYVAAGIGEVIASRASISGAQGGCQAEIGSASAMAASAVTYLKGGTSKQIADAAALALKSLLGLVCDPVAGLVEVPCVKRNVIGAVNAITSSDMVMAGIKSKIPADEVIDAMNEVGLLLPCSLKETSQAGLAVTPTGLKITEKLAKKSEY